MTMMRRAMATINFLLVLMIQTTGLTPWDHCHSHCHNQFEYPSLRFKPKEEELISSHLRSKINGHHSGVIATITLCEYEPWDLPAKSIIKTDHYREWFFFCPVDRKGNRVNRSTNTGYWKSTGPDRTIKSTEPNPTVIGMKKTLRFYKRCGPDSKDELTDWTIHEYRATEKDLDGSGPGQGAFVLCFLFQKGKANTMVKHDESLPPPIAPTPQRDPVSSSSSSCSGLTLPSCQVSLHQPGGHMLESFVTQPPMTFGCPLPDHFQAVTLSSQFEQRERDLIAQFERRERDLKARIAQFEQRERDLKARVAQFEQMERDLEVVKTSFEEARLPPAIGGEDMVGDDSMDTEKGGGGGDDAAAYVPAPPEAPPARTDVIGLGDYSELSPTQHVVTAPRSSSAPPVEASLFIDPVDANMDLDDFIDDVAIEYNAMHFNDGSSAWDISFTDN